MKDRRFTIYRHRFARVAPALLGSARLSRRFAFLAPRARRNQATPAPLLEQLSSFKESLIQRIVDARLAGLRGSSLRFPPIEATKPEVPRQQPLCCRARRALVRAKTSIFLCAAQNWDGRLAHAASRPARARATRVTELCRLNKMVTLTRVLRALSVPSSD